ncbi:MAG TPA: hypothetical protein VHM90_15195 [Phycisphaerae bacterium]|nr:hypothetical protein [Phycisphaerae bacterium]
MEEVVMMQASVGGFEHRVLARIKSNQQAAPRDSCAKTWVFVFSECDILRDLFAEAELKQ